MSRLHVAQCQPGGGEVVVTEVFEGLVLETEEGNRLGLAMRDDTFELVVTAKDGEPSHWRVDMQAGTINPMGGGENS